MMLYLAFQRLSYAAREKSLASTPSEDINSGIISANRTVFFFFAYVFKCFLYRVVDVCPCGFLFSWMVVNTLLMMCGILTLRWCPGFIVGPLLVVACRRRRFATPGIAVDGNDENDYTKKSMYKHPQQAQD